MSSRALPWIATGLVAGLVVLELASSPRYSSAAELPRTGPSGVSGDRREGGEVARPQEREPRRSATQAGRVARGHAASSSEAPESTLYTFDLLVLDGDDQPLSGASVYLAPWPQALAHAGCTDVRGHLRVQWRARRGSMRVAYAVAHPRHGASNLKLVELTERPFTAALELRSKPEATAGAPDASASSTSSAPQTWWTAERRRARLDEHGLLRFSAELLELPGERLELPRGWSLPGASRPAKPDLPEDVAQVHVHGIVREPDGDPVAGARVRASEAELDFEVSTRSRADGAFTLGPLPRDGAHLSVGGGDLGRYETELGAGVEPFQDLHPSLQRGRELSARWLDAVGRPLAGWRVELNDSASKSPWADVTWTDAHGRFVLPNVPGTMLGLDLAPPGQDPALPFDVVRGAWIDGERVFNARLGRDERAGLAVVVLDAHGAAVEDAEVLLAAVNGDRGVRIEHDCSVHAYRSRTLPPGRYRLWVHAPGQRSIHWPDELVLAAGSELDLGVLRFEEREPLVVELPAGLGATECRLESDDTDPPLVLGVFRARGRWRVDLPAGQYVLHMRQGDASRALRFELTTGRARMLRIAR